MSIASRFGSARTPSPVDAQSLKTIAARPLRATGFWAAVILPLAYPALMYGGVDGRELGFLLAALALNAAALVVGRDYKRDPPSGRPPA